MRELVFDTSVLVAGLRSKRGASYQSLRLIDANLFRIHISVALALEYEDVLKRKGLILKANGQQIDAFLDYLFTVAHLTPFVPRQRPSLRDPNDEFILEVTIQCDATIVTHNRRDFEGAERFGVSVKTPAEILKVLSNRHEHQH